MASTKSIPNISQDALDGLIAGLEREQHPADIIDDGTKVNILADYDPETLSLVTPEPDPSRIALLNLRYRNEIFYKPYVNARGEKGFSPDSVQFINGYLTCDRETADWIKSAAPYVYEEPQFPDTQPYTFEPDGFKTWHIEAYNTYSKQYFESQI